MEKNEKCFIITLPFKSISWFPSFNGENDFRIHLTPIKSFDCQEERVSFDVSILNENESNLIAQPNEGVQYTGDYFMYKTLTTSNLSGVRIEFIFNDEINAKVSSTVLFDDRSPGMINAPITDSELNVVGTLKVQYLTVKPCPFEVDNEPNPQFESFLKKGVHAGHRGAGVARRFDLPDQILENTILSLNYAIKHGAEMVEFDVQLSKDDVPILYHDYSVYASLKKKGSDEIEKLQLPIKDLTYQQMRTLKLGPLCKEDGIKYEFHDDDAPDHQPFCKLEDALKSVIPCAFNVEIKYETGSDGYKDLNYFVDTILKTIFDYHNNRDIIISSFDPTICAMAHLKQKKFPVLFLTYTEDRAAELAEAKKQGRVPTFELACYYAKTMSFAGVNCFAQNLLIDKSLVKYVINKELLLFCYGDPINTTSIVEDLMKDGVHGIIYDRIDVISPIKFVPTAGDANSNPLMAKKTTATA